MPELIEADHIATVKTKLAHYEDECSNLAMQVARSQQFLNEVQMKLIGSEANRKAFTELLADLQKSAAPLVEPEPARPPGVGA